MLVLLQMTVTIHQVRALCSPGVFGKTTKAQALSFHEAGPLSS